VTNWTPNESNDLVFRSRIAELLDKKGKRGVKGVQGRPSLLRLVVSIFLFGAL